MYIQLELEGSGKMLKTFSRADHNADEVVVALQMQLLLARAIWPELEQVFLTDKREQKPTNDPITQKNTDNLP